MGSVGKGASHSNMIWKRRPKFSLVALAAQLVSIALLQVCAAAQPPCGSAHRSPGIPDLDRL